MQRRTFLASGAASAAALAAPAAFAQAARLTPLKFTLDFRINGQTAPFFLAESKGYYKEEGLDVTIDTGAGSVASITRIASGVYQLGLGDISSLVEFNAQNPGTPMVQAVYQYYNRAPFVIIGRKDRGITTDFRSLEGKKIGAAAVESTRRAWPMVARKQGMKPDAFQWQTTDFSARDNVMVRGDVDAATYFHDSAISLFARMKPDELSVLKYADADRPACLGQGLGVAGRPGPGRILGQEAPPRGSCGTGSPCAEPAPGSTRTLPTLSGTAAARRPRATGPPGMGTMARGHPQGGKETLDYRRSGTRHRRDAAHAQTHTH